MININSKNVGMILSIAIAMCMILPVSTALISTDEPVIKYSGIYVMDLKGPMLNEWSNQMKSAGIEVVTRMHDNTFEIRVPDNTIMSGFSFIDSISEYPIDNKISKDIVDRNVIISLSNSDTLKSSLIELESYINSFQEGSTGDGYIIKCTLRDLSLLETIAAIPDVHFIAPYLPEELHGEMGMQIVGGGAWVIEHDDDNDINTPLRPTPTSFGAYVNQLGWSGAGVTIALADTGLGTGNPGDAGHPDFQNRVIGGTDYSSNGWADGHGHGTHCAGLAAGNTYGGQGTQYNGFGPYYAGMGLGYGSDVYSVRIFTGGGSWDGPADYKDILYDGYAGGANVHSNSWGSPSGGAYGDADTAYDQAIRDADPGTPGNQQLITFISAGNSGPGTNTIGSPGNSKNSITVGGVQNYMPDGTSHGNTYGNSANPDTMYSSSSRGWTDDGRIKPDILTPGENTLSTHSPSAGSNLFGLLSEDNTYEWCTGTSQSCPTAAGGGALIYEWYDFYYGEGPTPATVKALMINTAIDIGTPDIPNQNEGWGRMYLPPLFDQKAPFIIHQDPTELTTGVTDEYTFSYVNPAEPVKITLAYTDTYAASGAPVTLQNQVNLEVESPIGTIYHGNAFSGGFSTTGNPPATFDTDADGYDDRNNVECVYFAPGSLSTGQYTVRIIGTNVGTDCDNDGSDDQDYTLVMYNAVDVSSQGSISLDDTVYLLEDTALVSVGDTDLNTNPILAETVNVNVKSNSEPAGETLTLTETGPDTSIFENTITLSATNGAGIVQVSHDDTLTATYVDADDGSGNPATVTDTALIDGQVIPPTALTVEWWGSSVQTLFSDNFEDGDFSDWTTGGASNDWQIGTPAGLGGEHGNSDPVGASGGTYSIGNDLTGIGTYAGDYEANLATDSNYIYSPAIDCSAATNTELFFDRYLCVESPTFDHAYIEVSTNAVAWNQVWTNTAEVGDSSWGQQSYDISSWADGQPTVYIRFELGGSDGSYQYCGWNIDNFYVEGLIVGGTSDNCLNWTLSGDDGAGADDIAQYNIYRATDAAGPWVTPIGNVPAGTGQYIDLTRGEFDGTNWYYVVRAEDNVGNEDTNTNAIPEIPTSNIAPSSPNNPVPANTAVGIGLNPSLSVNVADPNGDQMDITFYDASGPTIIDTDNNVASGGVASVNWNGLSASSTYSWYVVADDGEFTTQSPTWSFSTMDITPPGPATGLTVEWWGLSFQTWIDEDFSTTVPPTGWTQDGPSTQWTQQNTANAGGTSPEARFAYVDNTDVWHLYAGPFDTTGLTSMDLQWQNMNNDYGTGVTCLVQTSSNAVTWTDTGWEWVSGSGDRAAALETLSLNTADVGSNTFYVSWTVDGYAYQLDYWYIDDVLLTSTGGGTTDDNWLNWTLSGDDGAGANDVDHYNIYRADNAAGPWDASAIIDTVSAGTATYTDSGAGETDGTIWWYVVRAEDIWGNEELNTNAVPEPGAALSAYDIQIPGTAGIGDWVLVSFPYVQSGNILSLLDDSTYGDGQTTWDMAKWYDPQDAADPWKSYSTLMPALSDMPALNQGMGVWLRLTTHGGDNVLTTGFTGDYSGSSVMINLYAGWNLVGFPSASSATAAVSLSGTGANMVAVYQAASPFVNDITNLNSVTMSAGNAYWVHVDADTIWTVNP